MRKSQTMRHPRMMTGARAHDRSWGTTLIVGGWLVSRWRGWRLMLELLHRGPGGRLATELQGH